MRSIRLRRSGRPLREAASLEAGSRPTRIPGLLSTAQLVAHPMFDAGPDGRGLEPAPGAYTPAQIQQAYQFNKISFNGVEGNGTGETIAIVDAYDDPNIQSDLNTFDTQFGLPSTTVTRVNETGGTSLPGGRFDGRLGARGVARRRVGARHGARGEDPAGRGQLGQRYRPAGRRRLRGGPCQCGVDELGRRRVLGRDGVRQRLQRAPGWRSWRPRATTAPPI